jgi:hypothetical protein
LKEYGGLLLHAIFFLLSFLVRTEHQHNYQQQLKITRITSSTSNHR